ncbi:MAG: Rieske (2Fe-2S) protein [Candidatus Poribacteria bacterium]|nr:Rieske (2Fe-2S) protein [Candidatus Poribacteria bacterium]
MERVKACALAELNEGQCRVVKHGYEYIAVIKKNDELHAINDTCPHMGGSLGTGWMTDEGTIVCPWHGWEFRLKDGEGVWPSGIKVETYPVQVDDDVIYVLMDDAKK